MFWRVIHSEMLKLRRAPIWIAFFALTALSAVMGTFNYRQNTGILHEQWYSLWTQHTLFASFFFLPSLLGVLCAYQWRLEHRENNFNALMTSPVPVWMVFGGKLAVAAGLVLLAQLTTGALYVACGLWVGFDPAALPPELPRWLMMGTCAGVCVVSLQLLLSMLMRSFAPPVGIALVGGIAGLMATSVGLGLCFPYSLMAMGMNANGNGALTPEHYTGFFVSCAVFTAAPWVLGVRALRRRDVVTHG